MARNRPVASVSGERGWAWNRRQAERRSEPTSPNAATTRTRADRPAAREGRAPPRHGADRRDVRELERDLERTERRLQSVITRYERLLTEKHRQLEEETDPEPAPGRLRAALSGLNRWLTVR